MYIQNRKESPGNCTPLLFVMGGVPFSKLRCRPTVKTDTLTF